MPPSANNTPSLKDIRECTDIEDLLGIRANLQKKEEKEQDNHCNCVEAERVALMGLNSARSPREYNDRYAIWRNVISQLNQSEDRLKSLRKKLVECEERLEYLAYGEE